MQPIPNIVSPAQPLAGGLMPVTGQPETASFDFMSYLLGLQIGSTDNVVPKVPPGAAAAKLMKDPSKDPLAALFTVPLGPQLPADLSMAASMAKPESVRASGPSNARSALPSEIPTMAPVDTSIDNELSAEPMPGFESDPLKGFRLKGFHWAEGEPAVEVSASRTSAAQAAKRYAASGPPVEKAPLPAEAEAAAPANLIKPPSSPVKNQKLVEGSETRPLVGFSAVTAFGLAASTDTTAASNAVTPQSISVPEVFQRVESLVQKGGGEMTVSLDPPDLGKLEIKVTARGNRVEVEMRSESLKAKSALESQLHDLRSAMQSNDLQLTKLEVQVHRDPQAFAGHSFAGMADGRSAGGAHGERNQGQARSLPETDRKLSSVSTVAPSTRSLPLVAGAGRIDRRV